jgi:hypothetical protein
MNPQALAPVLLALQFAAFGWRINREISLGDEGRRTWLPLPDLINIASVVALCVVRPLASGDFDRFAKVTLAVGYALIAFHPLNAAAHYRLFSRLGRSKYTRARQDYPLVTDQEVISLIISISVAIALGLWVWRAG